MVGLRYSKEKLIVLSPAFPKYCTQIVSGKLEFSSKGSGFTIVGLLDNDKKVSMNVQYVIIEGLIE